MSDFYHRSFKTSAVAVLFKRQRYAIERRIRLVPPHIEIGIACLERVVERLGETGIKTMQQTDWPRAGLAVVDGRKGMKAYKDRLATRMPACLKQGFD